jgi:hypothetical protein
MVGPLVAHVADAVEVINRLHGTAAMTPRQVRYLSQQGVIEPDMPAKEPGQSAFYRLTGLLLLDLYVRLLRAGVTPWRVRAFLLYAGGRVWEVEQTCGRFPLVVFDTFGAPGRLVERRDARTARGADVKIDLQRTAREVRASYDRMRRERPTVWAGDRWMDIREAAQLMRAAEQQKAIVGGGSGMRGAASV